MLDAHDDIVATSSFLEAEHRLWRYSDAGMHRRCFLAWKLQAEFVSEFNRIVSPLLAGDGTTRRILDDGSLSSVYGDLRLGSGQGGMPGMPQCA